MSQRKRGWPKRLDKEVQVVLQAWSASPSQRAAVAIALIVKFVGDCNDEMD